MTNVYCYVIKNEENIFSLLTSIYSILRTNTRYTINVVSAITLSPYFIHLIKKMANLILFDNNDQLENWLSDKTHNLIILEYYHIVLVNVDELFTNLHTNLHTNNKYNYDITESTNLKEISENIPRILNCEKNKINQITLMFAKKMCIDLNIVMDDLGVSDSIVEETSDSKNTNFSIDSKNFNIRKFINVITPLDLLLYI